MTLDQDIIANFSEVFGCLCGVLERSLERHSDRAGLARACERLPGEGAQQHGKVGD